MASSKMTLIGMYNWDDTIFSELLLPTGIDKDLFINSLLLQGGEFEVLYPDPNFMKNAIKIWGMKWFRTFAEWLKGTQAEWNPIYNYDRYEDARDDGYRNYSSINNADYNESKEIDLQDKRTADLKDERTLDLKDSQTKDLTDKNTFGNTDTTSQIKKSETEHQVAAYDSSTYQPSSKDIIDNGDSKVDHTGTVTVNSSGTDDTAHTGTDVNKSTGTDTMNKTGNETTTIKGKMSDIEGKDNNTNVRKAHMYGNIGVTTSAAMLKEFYDIAQWNLYEHMSDVFASELLVPVY